MTTEAAACFDKKRTFLLLMAGTLVHPLNTPPSPHPPPACTEVLTEFFWIMQALALLEDLVTIQNRPLVYFWERMYPHTGKTVCLSWLTFEWNQRLEPARGQEVCGLGEATASCGLSPPAVLRLVWLQMKHRTVKVGKTTAACCGSRESNPALNPPPKPLLDYAAVR